MSDKTEIYDGGFLALLSEHDKRQEPYLNAEIVLPPLDVDLEGLHGDLVPAATHKPTAFPKQSAQRKWTKLQNEFEGQSALLLVHAMTVSILRRRSAPQAAKDLFLRMWSEQGARLAEALPTRWLTAAAMTFADHGENADQRSLGMGLSLLFDLVKLHDSERRISGQAGDMPFRRQKTVRPTAMPLDMTPYALRNGDLDRVVLTRLWALCEQDATIRPLGVQMLWMVMSDRRTIFGRLQKFKKRVGE
jgi:hypothetical protein